MVKKYITTLKNGAVEQKAFILGRTITLYDGEVVKEGILTKTFPSLFEEIIDVKVEEPKVEEPKVEEKEIIIEPEELLIDESSNVEVISEPKEPKVEEKPKKSKSKA